MGQFLSKLGHFCEQAVEVVTLAGSKEECTFQLNHCLTNKKDQFCDSNKIIVATPTSLLYVAAALTGAVYYFVVDKVSATKSYLIID